MINNKLTLRKSANIGFLTIALSLLAFSAQAAIVNLVSNGNFETYTGGYTGGAFTNAPSELGNSGTGGYTSPTGWNVGAGSSGTYGFLFAPGTADTTGSHSVRFGSSSFTVWGPHTGGGSVANGLTSTSPSGGNFVALDAGLPSLRGTGISQTITGLSVGELYVLGFDWAAAQQFTFNGATTEKVQVSFGTSTKTTSTFILPEHGFSGWMHQKLTFVATSTTQTLNFLAVGTPESQPPFVLLDGVTLNVPEPETYALFGIGLLSMILAARRQNRRT
ncbi:MAG: PEP-CTERM sorting domain-containing protein [Methylovulum sp.]|nr:PEP-CTERM sorting domain-containing protein [Methylovulum sp.]